MAISSKVLLGPGRQFLLNGLEGGGGLAGTRLHHGKVEADSGLAFARKGDDRNRQAKGDRQPRDQRVREGRLQKNPGIPAWKTRQKHRREDEHHGGPDNQADHDQSPQLADAGEGAQRQQSEDDASRRRGPEDSRSEFAAQ